MFSDMKQITRKEVYRYLGYGRTDPDEPVLTLVEECCARLVEEARPVSVYRRFPVNVDTESGQIEIGEDMRVRSRDLAKNMAGCEEAYLFAATLGPVPDRLMREAEEERPAQSLVYHAAGAAYIEDYCDEINSLINQMCLREGLHTKPRFSPGYGNFSLEHQRDFMRILDLENSLGLTLTGSLLLVPEKSVTAVIGLYR